MTPPLQLLDFAMVRLKRAPNYGASAKHEAERDIGRNDPIAEIAQKRLDAAKTRDVTKIVTQGKRDAQKTI